jgi:hypothetical protein
MFHLGLGEQAYSVVVLPGHTDLGDVREYTIIVGTQLSLQVLKVHFAHVREDPSKTLTEFVSRSLTMQSNRDDLYFSRACMSPHPPPSSSSTDFLLLDC